MSDSAGRGRGVVVWVTVAGAIATIAGVLFGNGLLRNADSKGSATLPTVISLPPATVATTTTTGVVTTLPPTTTATRPATTTSVAEDPFPFNAQWQSGMNGWIGSEEWKTAAGALLSDGSSDFYSGDVRAPFHPPSADYAIDVRVKILSSLTDCYFAIIGRAHVDSVSGLQGYALGYSTFFGGAVIASITPEDYFNVRSSAAYSPTNSTRTYRAEFRGINLTLLIDGRTVLQATDTQFTDAGSIGMRNAHCQIEVLSYQVEGL